MFCFSAFKQKTLLSEAIYASAIASLDSPWWGCCDVRAKESCLDSFCQASEALG